jgi:hypothetical protein
MAFADGEAHRLDSMEINMSKQTKACEACFGKGNEPRMQFRLYPACGESGKAPVEQDAPAE